MYEKYTPVRQQALFAPFIQISRFYPFLFMGRGATPRYLANGFVKRRLELAQHLIESLSGAPANIAAGDFAG